MTRWLVLLVLLVSTSPVLAETIVFARASIPDVSRIVLDGAGAFSWTIGRTATGYALKPRPISR